MVPVTQNILYWRTEAPIKSFIKALVIRGVANTEKVLFGLILLKMHTSAFLFLSLTFRFCLFCF